MIRKIIFIMAFSSQPAEFENQPSPKYQWETGDGKKVGIWGLEWADLLLQALAEYYPEYDCEVWQPDLRADKTYTAQLQDRLVHRNFSARIKKVFRLYKFYQELYSADIIHQAKQMDNVESVFMLSANVRSLWMRDLVENVKNARLLFYTFLEPRRLLPDKSPGKNLITTVSVNLINRGKANWVRKMDNLFMGPAAADVISEISKLNPHIKMFPRSIGVDTEFWSRVKTREQARRDLGIPLDHYVILLSQRLVPEYQVDKFIEAVSKVRTGRPFCCYVTGHGTPDYETYLRDLVSRYKLEDKIRFTGFVSDELLRDHLIAADIFATFAREFAGSGGAIKAMALEIPVLHVNISGTYEFLRDHGAGIYISPHDYGQWISTLESLIGGMRVKTLPRQAVIDKFSWKGAADLLHNAIINLR